jgi:hypothetical protein
VLWLSVLTAPIALSCVGVPGEEPCASTDFLLGVPASRANDVATVNQKGPGCDGFTPQCEDPPACTFYGIRPSSENARGACSVTVTFKSGAATFQTTTNFESEGGSSCGTVANPYKAVVPE